MCVCVCVFKEREGGTPPQVVDEKTQITKEERDSVIWFTHVRTPMSMDIHDVFYLVHSQSYRLSALP